MPQCARDRSMKNLFALMALLLSFNGFAVECPVQFGTDDYMDKVMAAIESQTTCRDASAMTEACAMGSSMDVQFVSSALKLCSKRVNRSATVKKAVESANRLCTKKYAKSEGTLAMSARSFCLLEITELYDGLLSPAEL